MTRYVILPFERAALALGVSKSELLAMAKIELLDRPFQDGRRQHSVPSPIR